MELYFIVNKTKADQRINNILLQVGIEGLKLTEEEKCSPDIIFGKFLDQLEPKEKHWVNRLKLMSYRVKAEKLHDDFVAGTKMFPTRDRETGGNNTICYRYHPNRKL